MLSIWALFINVAYAGGPLGRFGYARPAQSSWAGWEIWLIQLIALIVLCFVLKKIDEL